MRTLGADRGVSLVPKPALNRLRDHDLSPHGPSLAPSEIALAPIISAGDIFRHKPVTYCSTKGYRFKRATDWAYNRKAADRGWTRRR